MRIKVIGKRGSSYARQLRAALGDHRIGECQGAVNFGLQGTQLEDYKRRFPGINALPMLNARQFGNKYQCVQAASEAGVIVPASNNVLEAGMPPDCHYIAKPYYSLGGRDIHRIRREYFFDSRTHYIQEEITNRRYEMRVHCWKWIDPQRWVFQKRVHPDGNEQLTWNYHTGGSFITINEPVDPLHARVRQSVQTLMRTFNYQFGAVDFIIANAGQRGGTLPHYFIEWNLAPGWTLEHIQEAYINNFQALESLNPDEFRSLLTPDGFRLTEPQVEPVQMLEADRRAPTPSMESQPMGVEMNFCPNCGRPVNNNLFGIVPRFCPSCGQRVRD